MSSRDRTILVVDDDRDFRKAICAIIRAGGYRAVEEADALAVLRTITEISPDLVLLDLYMPGVKGVELVRSMKELKISVPVLIVTGMVSVEDFQSLCGLGVDDFLAKPVTKADLMKKIIQALPQAGEKDIVYDI
ncbi:response regulator [Gemmatimonadota bacterium]